MAEIIILMNVNQELQIQEKESIMVQHENSTNLITIWGGCFECTWKTSNPYDCTNILHSRKNGYDGTKISVFLLVHPPFIVF